MNKRWLLIVLFISLAFNLAVMLMFSYASIYHRPPFCPPGMRQEMNRDRDKRPEDNLKPALKKLVEENRAEMEKARKEFAQTRKDFMQTLVQDTLNVKEAEAAMDASLKSHEDLERNLGNSLINLRKNMTSEEAKAFFKERIDRMQRKSDRFRHRHPRFDNQNDHQGDKP